MSVDRQVSKRNTKQICRKSDKLLTGKALYCGGFSSMTEEIGEDSDHRWKDGNREGGELMMQVLVMNFCGQTG